MSTVTTKTFEMFLYAVDIPPQPKRMWLATVTHTVEGGWGSVSKRSYTVPAGTPVPARLYFLTMRPLKPLTAFIDDEVDTIDVTCTNEVKTRVEHVSGAWHLLTSAKVPVKMTLQASVQRVDLLSLTFLIAEKPVWRIADATPIADVTCDKQWHYVAISDLADPAARVSVTTQSAGPQTDSLWPIGKPLPREWFTQDDPTLSDDDARVIGTWTKHPVHEAIPAPHISTETSE